MHIALLILLGFFSGLLEGIGITAIIPLFSYLLGQEAPVGNALVEMIVKLFDYLPFVYSPLSLLAFIVGLFFVRAIVMIFFYYFRTRVSSSYMIRTMSELLSKILGAEWRYLLTQRLGYAEMTLTRDVQQGAALLESISQAALVFTSLVIYVALAIYISPIVTLLTAISGFLLLLVYQPLRSKVRAVSTEAARVEKDISHFLNEHTLGLKTVKSAAVEREVFTKGLLHFDQYKNILLRSTLFQSMGTSFMQPIALFFIAVIFAFFFYGRGVELGSFVALIYLIQKIFTYVEGGQSALHNLFVRLPYVENILTFSNILSKHEEKDKGKKPFVFSSSIEFQDVHFSYGEDHLVLKAISFRILRGGLIGLIGPSGSGKTSIADLLLRLFEPNRGNILIDGEDVRTIDLREWRRKIGYVSQDMFLIDGTIEENIRFYSHHIGRADIKRGAELASCMEFIDKLPHGIKTVVGDRGIRLSAGQRQRIILARVLARNPEVLILDEATSALDNESERLIQAAIDNLKNTITVFMIAHRLSTVKNVDSILVLKDGVIAEEGSPEKLGADTSSYFYRMSSR